MSGSAAQGARSLLLLLLLLGSQAERIGLHAHALHEDDLAPHSLAVIEGGGDTLAIAHLDAGAVRSHPVCIDCILTACAAAVPPHAVARLSRIEGRRLATVTRSLAFARAPTPRHSPRAPPSSRLRFAS